MSTPYPEALKRLNQLLADSLRRIPVLWCAQCGASTVWPHGSGEGVRAAMRIHDDWFHSTQWLYK